MREAFGEVQSQLTEVYGWRPVDGGLQAPLRSRSTRNSLAVAGGIFGVVSRRSVRPTVARMVTASSIPRAAVAMSGIM